MIIEHIADICGFPFDSTTMDVIAQQSWAEVSDDTTLTLTEVSDLKFLKDDGTYGAKLLAHHLCKLKCFLLYLWKCWDLLSNHDKYHVLNMSKMEFNDYCGLPEYYTDFANGLTPSTKSASTLVQAGVLTASEFRRNIKRNKTHYAELNDDKHFTAWNHGFVVTAIRYHTQFVLDGDYVPVLPTEDGLFR
jgi:hypothetical protein